MSDLYDDCPDGTYLDYPMMYSGRVTEIKEAKMTGENDEKEFEELFKAEMGYWNNIPNRHDLAKYFFMESRRRRRDDGNI